MSCEVELRTLDRRYEPLRMKNPKQEARLLCSIAERGIEEPLEGVDVEGRRVLLNGFKRVRCALKLGVASVPYASLGSDEVLAMAALLRPARTRGLTILEEAGFVEELRGGQGLSVAEIAELLSRSKGWVSMRLGLLAEMTETIRRTLLSGAFPVYAYMYTLRGFMRMNKVGPRQIEEFVRALAGKGLSLREIEQLAHGFFRGPEWFREQIRSGNLALPLEQIRGAVPEAGQDLSGVERGLLKDLETTARAMQRVMGKSQSPQLKNRGFHVQAHLLTAGILSRSTAFFHTVRRLHDRCGQA